MWKPEWCLCAYIRMPYPLFISVECADSGGGGVPPLWQFIWLKWIGQPHILTWIMWKGISRLASCSSATETRSVAPSFVSPPTGFRQPAAIMQHWNWHFHFFSLCTFFYSHWKRNLLFFFSSMEFMWSILSARVDLESKLWSWNTKSCEVMSSQFDWTLDGIFRERKSSYIVWRVPKVGRLRGKRVYKVFRNIQVLTVLPSEVQVEIHIRD